jgi:hypothetical protein
MKKIIALIMATLILTLIGATASTASTKKSTTVSCGSGYTEFTGFHSGKAYSSGEYGTINEHGDTQRRTGGDLRQYFKIQDDFGSNLIVGIQNTTSPRLYIESNGQFIWTQAASKDTVYTWSMTNMVNGNWNSWKATINGHTESYFYVSQQNADANPDIQQYMGVKEIAGTSGYCDTADVSFNQTDPSQFPMNIDQGPKYLTSLYYPTNKLNVFGG